MHENTSDLNVYRRSSDNTATLCTASRSIEGQCEGRAIEGAPVAICFKHALSVYQFMQGAIDATPMEFRRSVLSEIQQPTPKRMPKRVVDVVYYIEFEGMVKIGFSNDLRRRYKAYPPTARLLAVEHGTRRLERERLEQFYEYRTARKEWHEKGPKLMAHIRKLQEVNQAA